ncbi:MAG TPA: class I SAM-dependent methyltransferase [Motilibacteraceae bacterium]|nr:class I SAM-dependent methyltransferase [Motilibacteraceae bacterium]
MQEKREGGGMDERGWDERYAASELVWSAGPNRFVEELAADLTPGRALDLAGGEGRNALWLAERGWTADVVDFSAVALERARRLADERLGERAASLRTVHADLAAYEPEPGAYDLVLVVYLQVPAPLRSAVVRRAADAVAPGGRLFVVAHDSDNLEHGVGGPQDPAVLYRARDLVTDVEGSGLDVVRAEQVRRAVATDAGERQALDALLLAVRADVG